MFMYLSNRMTARIHGWRSICSLVQMTRVPEYHPSKLFHIMVNALMNIYKAWNNSSTKNLCLKHNRLTNWNLFLKIDLKLIYDYLVRHKVQLVREWNKGVQAKHWIVKINRWNVGKNSIGHKIWSISNIQ